MIWRTNQASSIALAPLGTIGKIASGLPIISSAGTALQAGVRRSDASLAQGSSEKFVSRANTGYFLPRGLQVQLVSGKDLRTLLCLPPADQALSSSSFSSSSGVNAFETFTKHVRIPIVSGISRGVLKAVKPVGPIRTMTAEERELLELDYHTRRLASVAGSITPLQTNDLPASTLRSKVGNAWQSYTSRVDLAEARAKDTFARNTLSLRGVGRGEITAAQWASEHRGQYGRDSYGRRYEHEDGDRAEEAEKNAIEKGGDQGLEREAERVQRKEILAAETTLWLVVRPMAQSTRRMTSVPVAQSQQAASASHMQGSSPGFSAASGSMELGVDSKR